MKNSRRRSTPKAEKKPLRLCFTLFVFSGLLSILLPLGIASADVLATYTINSNAGAGPLSPSATNPNAAIGQLTLGSGVSASVTANTFGGTLWGAASNSSESTAIAGSFYEYFTVTANAGFNESFTSFSPYNARRSATGPDTGIWQYQVGAGSFIDIGSAITWGTVTAGAGNPQASIDLSGISDLQSVAAGTTVTFRVLDWRVAAGGGTGGTWYLNGQGTDGGFFTVNGSVITTPNDTGLFWTANGTTLGGTGTWGDTTPAHWSTSDVSVSGANWNNSGFTAVFKGTPGTVTLSGTGVTVNPTMGNSLRFDVGGYTVTGGTINLASSTPTIYVTRPQDTATIGSLLSTSNGVTKDGAGTLVLTANNTYGGNTNVAAGTLQIGNGGSTGSITGDVTNSGTFAFNHSGTLTYSGNISGGTFEQRGPTSDATVVLTGNDSPAATNVTGGVLQVGDGSNGSLSGPVDVSSGATIAFNQPGTTTYSSAITGSGSLHLISPTTLKLTGPSTYNGGSTVENGATLQVGDSNGTTGTLFGNVNLVGASSTLSYNRGNGVTFSDNVTGIGSLVQAGTGTLSMTGTVAPTVSTSINFFGGAIQIGNGGATGEIQGNVDTGVANGRLIFNRNNSFTMAGNIIGSGSVTQAGSGDTTVSGNNNYTNGTSLTGGGILRAASATAFGDSGGAIGVTKGSALANSGLTIPNTINVTSASGVSGNLLVYWDFDNFTANVNSSFPSTFNSTSGGTGLSEVYDSGTKKFTGAGAGVFAGSAYIDVSGIQGQQGQSLPPTWGSFTGTTVNITTPNGPGNGGGNGSFILSGSANEGSSLVFEVPSSGFHNLVGTYATRYSSSAAYDTQQWSYSTDGNNYTDLPSSVTVSSSNFALETVDFSAAAGTALDDQANVFLKVTFSGYSNTATNSTSNNRIDNVQILAKPFVNYVPDASIGSDSSSGTTFFTGPITLNADVGLTAATGGTVEIDGAISDGSITGNYVVKNGGGLVLLTNSNSYSGPTTVNAGTLQLGNDNAIGPGSGNLIVNSGGTLDINGHNTNVGGLGGNGGVITTSVAGSKTLTVGNGNATMSSATSIQNGSGVISLLKTGTGTQTITGSSSFSGGTTVANGVLAVGGSYALGTGPLTVNSGKLAKLVTGTAGGPVVMTSLALAGGASPTATLDITNSKAVITNTSYASAVSAYTVARRKSPMPWMALPGINPASPAPRWPTTLITWGCPPAWR